MYEMGRRPYVEPGVSVRNENTAENTALMVLGCIGNGA